MRLGSHTLLWLWCRTAAAAPIQPLAWELLYAGGVALKSKTHQKTKIICCWTYHIQQFFHYISLWHQLWLGGGGRGGSRCGGGKGVGEKRCGQACFLGPGKGWQWTTHMWLSHSDSSSKRVMVIVHHSSQNCSGNQIHVCKALGKVLVQTEQWINVKRNTCMWTHRRTHTPFKILMGTWQYLRVSCAGPGPGISFRVCLYFAFTFHLLLKSPRNQGWRILYSLLLLYFFSLQAFPLPPLLLRIIYLFTADLEAQGLWDRRDVPYVHRTPHTGVGNVWS